jgi:D-alanyl-D-alanine carboxypeptidase
VRLALASLLLAGSAEAQQPARQAAAADVIHSRLQRVLDSLRFVSGSPGITLGVALPDGRVLGLASGMADTARRIPLEPDDLLLAGSVGKTFFAALAVALIQDGKLSLDAPISTWLGSEPWFSRRPNGPAVTVRMLMNLTSGLVRYEFKDAFTRDLTAGPDRIWRPEELVAYLLDEPAPFEAGKGWDYSDTNYIVLGMILERITGNAAYAEIQQRFLDPHGLRDVIPSTARRIPGLAQSYAGLPNPFGGRDEMLDAEGRLAINPQFEWAGGGFATSAPALARWARVFYEGAAVDFRHGRAGHRRGGSSEARNEGLAEDTGVRLAAGEGGARVESGGGLVSADWTKAFVPAPADREARPLKGSGWTLELASGWRLVPGSRAGSWRVEAP